MLAKDVSAKALDGQGTMTEVKTDLVIEKSVEISKSADHKGAQKLPSPGQLKLPLWGQLKLPLCGQLQLPLCWPLKTAPVRGESFR